MELGFARDVPFEGRDVVELEVRLEVIVDGVVAMVFEVFEVAAWP